MNHSDFVNELKKRAYSFNPNSMSKEDAIMKILEDYGLDHMFSNNPTMKGEICKIVSSKLAKNGISSINQENVEQAKSIIKGFAEINNANEISFKTFETDSSNNKKTIKDSFIMNPDKSATYSKDISTEQYATSIELSKSVKTSRFNKYGLEIEEKYEYIDNQEHTIDGYSLKRNDDLITGEYTPLNNRGISCTIDVGSEHPEKMGGIRPSAAEVNEHFQNKEPEPGFVDYPRNEGEKRQQLDTRKILLEAYSKQSQAFRNTAEKNGIIDPSIEK